MLRISMVGKGGYPTANAEVYLGAGGKVDVYELLPRLHGTGGVDTLRASKTDALLRLVLRDRTLSGG